MLPKPIPGEIQKPAKTDSQKSRINDVGRRNPSSCLNALRMKVAALAGVTEKDCVLFVLGEPIAEDQDTLQAVLDRAQLRGVD